MLFYNCMVCFCFKNFSLNYFFMLLILCLLNWFLKCLLSFFRARFRFYIKHFSRMLYLVTSRPTYLLKFNFLRNWFTFLLIKSQFNIGYLLINQQESAIDFMIYISIASLSCCGWFVESNAGQPSLSFLWLHQVFYPLPASWFLFLVCINQDFQIKGRIFYPFFKSHWYLL